MGLDAMSLRNSPTTRLCNSFGARIRSKARPKPSRFLSFASRAWSARGTWTFRSKSWYSASRRLALRSFSSTILCSPMSKSCATRRMFLPPWATVICLPVVHWILLPQNSLA